MNKSLTLLGLSGFLLLMSGCGPLPQKHARYIPHTPRVTPPSTRHNYIPPAQHNYIPPAPNYSPAIQARQKVVQLAYQQLGTRYKYGGSNPREGFDCSGLMTYIYKQGSGIKLPRTAAQQRDKSRLVRYENLQAGDMLFFKTGAKTNHVGIYVGNRQFIHAPNRRSRVKITSMDNSYWFSKFVKFGTYFD